MIRLVGRFVFVNAFFAVDDAVDYESMGINRPTESVPVRFDVESVVAWNMDEPNQTFVRLATGHHFNLDCSIDVFDEFMAKHGSV